MDVNPDKPAARRADAEQRRPTRPAGNLEHSSVRPETELCLEATVLVGRRPRKLADILAERVGTNSGVHLVRRSHEIPIVEPRIGRRSHPSRRSYTTAKA